MAIELERGSSDAETAASPTGHHRARRLGLAVVVLLALATAAVAWAWNYQPLRSLAIGGVEAPGATVRAASNSYGTEYWLSEPEPGSVVTLNLSVEVPDGVRFPVTIEDVASPFQLTSDGPVAYVESSDVSYRVNAQGNPIPLSDGPVTLESGEFLMLSVELVIPDCPRMDDGAMVGTDTVPLTYSTFGITHEMELPLGYKVNLRNAPECR